MKYEKSLSKLSKRLLLSILDEYWLEWVDGLGIAELKYGYLEMLTEGQVGYSKFTKQELIKYIIRNFDDEEIAEFLTNA